MRYFIGFLVTIGLIILIIFLLFHGGGKKITPKSLNSYASTDAQAIMTIDGPINAESLHQQIKIIVDNIEVTYEQINGYNGSIVATQTFPSSQNAYYNFLSALDHAGYTRGVKSDAGSETGWCPLGQRYIFEVNQNGDDLQRFWATSCGSPKTYNGNLGLTVTLFQNQVPNYGTLTQNVQL